MDIAGPAHESRPGFLICCVIILQMDSYILVFPNGYCLSICAIRDRLWINGSDEAIKLFQAVLLRCDCMREQRDLRLLRAIFVWLSQIVFESIHN